MLPLGYFASKGISGRGTRAGASAHSYPVSLAKFSFSVLHWVLNLTWRMFGFSYLFFHRCENCIGLKAVFSSSSPLSFNKSLVGLFPLCFLLFWEDLNWYTAPEKSFPTLFCSSYNALYLFLPKSYLAINWQIQSSNVPHIYPFCNLSNLWTFINMILL